MKSPPFLLIMRTIYRLHGWTNEVKDVEKTTEKLKYNAHNHIWNEETLLYDAIKLIEKR